MKGKISMHFPYTAQYTYLNTPAYGLLSEELMEWRQEHDLDYLIGGSRFKERSLAGLAKVRDAVAAYCGAVDSKVYLVPNFSFGWKVLCGGLDKKTSFLLLDGDYPSLNWPVISGGFRTVRKVVASAEMEDAILKAFETEVPDVFAFSMVQYLNGLQLSGDFVRELKGLYPKTLFVADGTQYLGTDVFDFEASGIDILGASGYKWLLAGTGNGFFLVKPGIDERFYLQTLPFEPQPEPFLKDLDHLQNHLEPGHLDSLSMGSLHKAIGLLQETGIQEIASELRMLRSYAGEQLASHGFLDPRIMGRKEHAPFFALEVSEKQQSALESRDVVFAVRGGKMRVGFHFYNKKEEVDRLVNILKKSSGV